jgi:hypothetical protein
MICEFCEFCDEVWSKGIKEGGSGERAYIYYFALQQTALPQSVMSCDEGQNGLPVLFERCDSFQSFSWRVYVLCDAPARYMAVQRI